MAESNRATASNGGAKQAVDEAARRVGIVAVLCGAAYLVWRWGWSWRGGSSSDVVWWLAGPALVIETLGFAASALLIWALAARTRSHAGVDTSSPDPLSSKPANADGDVDVVVFTGRHGLVDLRATLVALRLDRDAPRAVVVDTEQRSEVEQLVGEFDGTYVVAGDDDPAGLAAGIDQSTRPFLVLLTAGDIPALDLCSALTASMVDPSVAAVQGIVAAPNGDSAEHSPSGRHDLFFERVALDPALGRRGAAMLTGSGSLIRRSSLDAIELPPGNRWEALWTLTSRFAVLGQRVVMASDEPIVTQKPLASVGAVANDRRDRASAAWRLVSGDDGVVRGLDVGVPARLSMMTWAVRPLESVRRLAFTTVVLGSLLSGRLPFDANLLAIFGLWAPAFVLTSIALALLSGASLRPGDRLRTSVRSVRVSLPLLVAINSVLVVRGISDRFTHAMRPMDQSAQVGLVIAALWVLAGCLDSLRLLARGRHGRRAARLRASTTGVLGDETVHVADVTMLGAGLVADRPVEIGTRLTLSFSMPSDSGITSLEVPAIVRNLRLDETNAWRIGVEFEQPDTYSLDTLAECCVVLPSRAMLAGEHRQPISRLEFEDDLADDQGPSRFALRVATLLALAAVISSAVPLGVNAGAPRLRTVSGFVVAADLDPSPETSSPGSAPDTSGAPTPDTSTPGTAAPGSSAPTTNSSTDPSSSEASVAPSSTPDATAPDATAPDATAATVAATSGLGGLTVVGACSTDPGVDGRYGTDDDVYGPSVSTTTDDDGHYSLTLDGEACWVSIAPPLPKIASPDVVNVEQTSEPPVIRAVVVDLSDASSPTLPAIAVMRTTIASSSSPTRPPTPTASIVDRIWADLDGDGTQQAGEAGVFEATVTLYDQAGHPLQSTATDEAGSFAFERLSAGLYSIGVTNLPIGLRPPNAEVLDSRSPLMTVRAGEHVTTGGIGLVRLVTARASIASGALPEPAVSQLSPTSSNDGADGLVTMTVILMASVLAASVLFASATPIRVRRPTSQ